MKILPLILLILPLLPQSQRADPNSACEARAQEVLRTLEPHNSLRYALERGERGDCIHQPWMDSMRRFGLKQASFLIEYNWKKNEVIFKIKSRTYLEGYYSNSAQAIGGRRLRDIQRSGLERELSEVVLARVKTGSFAIHHRDTVYPDVFEANILDDESLPVLDIIF